MRSTTKNRKFVWGITLLTALFTLVSPTFGAAFVKYDGIDGESKDKDHKGWSDLLSFSQGMSRPDPTDQGSGTNRKSTSKHKPLTITKPIDKASPLLMHFANNGATLPSITVEQTRQYQGRQVPYLKIELKNVLITSYSISGDGEAVPTEDFSLNYEEIKWTYMVLTPGDKDQGKTVQSGWNTRTNEPILR